MSNLLEEEEWTELKQQHVNQKGQLKLKCAQVLIENRNPKASKKRGKRNRKGKIK